MGEVDVGRECGVDFGVESHFVAHMCQIGLSGCDTGYDVECFGQAEVGEVFILAQGVDNEDVEVAEFLEFGIGEVVHIGDVGEGSWGVRCRV